MWSDLALGFRYFLRFALDVEAITQTEADLRWSTAWNALSQAAQTQAQHQVVSDPARRFIELLTAAIASGRAHIVNTSGSVPPNPDTWGWRADGATAWHAQGERIGWVDTEDLYLSPDTSFAVAQHLARDQGDSLPITQQTLRKRLRERAYLASWDDARETLTVRRMLGGQQRSVLHLRTAALYPVKKPDIQLDIGKRNKNKWLCPKCRECRVLVLRKPDIGRRVGGDRMTEAVSLIARCRDLGVTLAPGPEGKLRVAPPGRLPEALREELRKRKVEVLSLDVWAEQGSYLEVWLEKDALSGIFEDALRPSKMTKNHPLDFLKSRKHNPSS